MKAGASELVDSVTCKPEFVARFAKLTAEEKLRLADSFQIVAERIRNGVSKRKRVKKVQKQITINIWENFKRGGAQ